MRRLLLIVLLPLLLVLKLIILPFERRARRTREEVAKYLRDFLSGSGDDWAWDDFICVPIRDAELERIRSRCLHLDEEFPANQPGRYCSDEGMKVVREYLEALERVEP